MSAVISVVNPARYRAGTTRLMTTVGIGTTVPRNTMTVGIASTMTKPGDFAVLFFSQDNLNAAYSPPSGWTVASSTSGTNGIVACYKTLTQNDINLSSVTVSFATSSATAMQLYNFRPYYSEPINTSFSESVGSYLSLKGQTVTSSSGGASSSILIPLSSFAGDSAVRITIQYAHAINVTSVFVNTPSYAGGGTGIAGNRTISGFTRAQSFYGIFPDTNNYSVTANSTISTIGGTVPQNRAISLIFALNPRFG